MKDSPLISILVLSYQHGHWNAGVVAHQCAKTIKSNVTDFFRYLSVLSIIEQYLEPFTGSNCVNSTEVSAFTRSHCHPQDYLFVTLGDHGVVGIIRQEYPIAW